MARNWRIHCPIWPHSLISGLALVVALSPVFACGGGPTVHPEKSHTRLALAEDFLHKGQLEAATEEANKALAYDPHNEEAENVLGLVSFLRALANFRLIEVNDCLTGADAAELRKEMNDDLLAADRDFVRAIHIDHDYGEARSNRGSVAMQLGNYRAAVRDYESALGYPARLTNAALTRANLGWAYFKLRRYAKAATELRQAAQFEPGMCIASYRLGRVYFARKQWEKALAKFREVAAQASCPIQEAHLYLMKTYAALGMTAELADAKPGCVKLAPKSCLAAQCRSLVP